MTMVPMRRMMKVRIIIALIAALHVFVGGWSEAAEGDRATIHVSAAGTKDGDGTAARPMASLAVALAKRARPGTSILIDEKAGPLVEDVAIGSLRGEPGRPIVIRAKGPGRATLHGRLRLTGAAQVVLERLAIEPRPGDRSGEPWGSIEGADLALRALTI